MVAPCACGRWGGQSMGARDERERAYGEHVCWVVHVVFEATVGE